MPRPANGLEGEFAMVGLISVRLIFFTCTLAALAFADGFSFEIGSPVASQDFRTKTSAFVFRTQGCSDPAKPRIEGSAEGLVNGMRRSIVLKLTALDRPGVYAVAQNWPMEGRLGGESQRRLRERKCGRRGADRPAWLRQRIVEVFPARGDRSRNRCGFKGSHSERRGEPMRSAVRFVPALAVAGAALLMAASIGSLHPVDLTVHEWGTFTSIAGDDGMAIDWEPLDGPSDLPCFVHRFEVGAKAQLSGTVRMETPVIYLYGPEGSNVSVRVSFPNGFITEWYPKANRVATFMGSGIWPKRTGRAAARQISGEPPDSIEWPAVKLAARLRRDRFPHWNSRRATTMLAGRTDSRRAYGGGRDGQVSVLPGRREVSAADRGTGRRMGPYCGSGPWRGADSGGDSVPESRRGRFLTGYPTRYLGRSALK